MFKWIVVTLAAFVIILQVVGDPSRRPAVTRDAPVALTLASMIGLNDPIAETSLEAEPLLSDADAVSLAIEAGKRVRLEQTTGSRKILLRGTPGAVQPVQVAATVEKTVDTPVATWVVSGSRVNLRQGPGTSNAVVTQVTFGTEAEVIGAQNGWMQIVTADGATTGWISGKFLIEQAPG